MRVSLAVLLSTLALASAPAMAATPCSGFKWDVRQEVALFAGPSIALTAGKNDASAQRIGVGHLYQLQLVPQATVAFAMTPGKSTAVDGAYAGLADLRLEKPGNYRVAVDAPLWIDLVVNGRLAAATDFQGQQSCDGPHKIVEFDLSSATHFVLQVSGSAKSTVRLTVTHTPPRAL